MIFHRLVRCIIYKKLKKTIIMNITAIEVNVIPKTNIGIIKFKGRIMVWQNLIDQYCYLPGF